MKAAFLTCLTIAAMQSSFLSIKTLLEPGFLFNALTVVATVVGLFLLVNRSSIKVVRVSGALLVVAMAGLNLFMTGVELSRYHGCGGSFF